MFFDLIHVSRYTHIRDPGFPRRLYLYFLGEVSMKKGYTLWTDLNRTPTLRTCA